MSSTIIEKETTMNSTPTTINDPQISQKEKQSTQNLKEENVSLLTAQETPQQVIDQEIKKTKEKIFRDF